MASNDEASVEMETRTVPAIVAEIMGHMRGQTGSATLHFKEGKPIRLEIKTFTRVDGEPDDAPVSE